MGKRLDILDVLVTGLAAYGAYKIATHPKTKKTLNDVKNFIKPVSTDNTVDYVSEEEANNNAKDKYVDVASPCRTVYKGDSDNHVTEGEANEIIDHMHKEDLDVPADPFCRNTAL